MPDETGSERRLIAMKAKKKESRIIEKFSGAGMNEEEELKEIHTDNTIRRTIETESKGAQE